MESASKLRGLKIKQRVPCRLQNKAAVEQYLRSTIKKKMSEERVALEGQTYRMLGLVPKDYDYLNKVVELYTDQLGGYYDPEKKYYAMADWMPGVIQMPIAVHELTHALQDQHFDLEGMMDHRHHSSDRLLARAALVEGDATAVMLDYTRSLTGQPSLAKEESVSMFMIQNISGALLSQSLRQAPSALQASLLFPYVSGLNFAHALLRKGGYQALDRGLSNPPQSTEEILHPTKYLSGKKEFAQLPDPPAPEGAELNSQQPVFVDTLGEFVLSALLATWIAPNEASAAAAGWAGDRLALYQAKGSAKWVLTWDLAWDSSREAEGFLDALAKAYTARFGAQPETRAAVLRFTDADFGTVEIENMSAKTIRLRMQP